MAKKKKRLEKKVTIGGKRISVYGFTALEIQQKIEKLEAEEERRKFPYFNDVADMWQEEHFEQIEQGTRTCYMPALKRAKAEFKNIRLCDISPMDISSFLKSLADLKYSRQTVTIQRVVINFVFKYAQSHGLIQSNPTEFAVMPAKLPSKQREIPDDKTLSIIMNSSDLPFGLFPLFLLLTGCRRGEALAVLWQDMDLINKRMTVHRDVTFNGNIPIVKMYTKTAAGMRTISIPDILCSQLKIIEKNFEADDYVFGNGKKPFTQTQFRNRWNGYIKATGISVTPHQLRHAYATILFDAKIDEKVAQVFMGHSKIEVTRNIYTHIRQQRAAEAQININEYLKSFNTSNKNC